MPANRSLPEGCDTHPAGDRTNCPLSGVNKNPARQDRMSDATRRSIGVGEITIVFAVSALGLLLRAPDALLNPQFIAEDGSVFFAHQFGRLLPPLFGPVQ